MSEDSAARLGVVSVVCLCLRVCADPLVHWVRPLGASTAVHSLLKACTARIWSSAWFVMQVTMCWCCVRSAPVCVCMCVCVYVCMCVCVYVYVCVFVE